MAAMAAICLAALGGSLLFPQSGNAFELKAYAMEQLADGSIERREVDLVNGAQAMSFNDDGENVYINIWLRCDGENIDKIDFYVDEGFFAKQHIIRGDLQNAIDMAPMTVSGSTIMRYGDDYVNVGGHLTLSADEMTEDLLVFWGWESRRIGNDLNLPSELAIRAVSTFNDGKTQEETLEFALSQPGTLGIGTFTLSQEEIARGRADALSYGEFLHSIPLEKCEVVPGSEKTLTYGDTFEYEIIGPSGFNATGMYPITEESMGPSNDRSLGRDGRKGLFDENGVARFGASNNLYDLWDGQEGGQEGGQGDENGDGYDGYDGYIAVIETNGDGTFTGKTYKVPGWLIRELMQ